MFHRQNMHFQSNPLTTKVDDRTIPGQLGGAEDIENEATVG